VFGFFSSPLHLLATLGTSTFTSSLTCPRPIHQLIVNSKSDNSSSNGVTECTPLSPSILSILSLPGFPNPFQTSLRIVIIIPTRVCKLDPISESHLPIHVLTQMFSHPQTPPLLWSKYQNPKHTKKYTASLCPRDSQNTRLHACKQWYISARAPC